MTLVNFWFTLFLASNKSLRERNKEEKSAATLWQSILQADCALKIHARKLGRVYNLRQYPWRKKGIPFSSRPNKNEIT
jgi:hypothetical protein